MQMWASSPNFQWNRHSPEANLSALPVTAAGAAALPPLAPLPRRTGCWNCCFFLWKGATVATGLLAWLLSSSAGSAATDDAMSWA
jgi:hypothetical protein